MTCFECVVCDEINTKQANAFEHTTVQVEEGNKNEKPTKENSERMLQSQ